MEGACLKPADPPPAAGLPLYPLLQFAGRLVCKSHCRNLRRLYFSLLQQVQDTGGKRPRLARPRPGNDSNGTCRTGNSMFLLFIERVSYRPLFLCPLLFCLLLLHLYLYRLFVPLLLWFLLLSNSIIHHRSLSSRICTVPAHAKQVKEVHLSACLFYLARLKQPDGPIFPVESRHTANLPLTEPSDSFRNQGTGRATYLFYRYCPQYVELRPEPLQHTEIFLLHARAGGSMSYRSPDYFRQGHQAFKPRGVRLDIAFLPV